MRWFKHLTNASLDYKVLSLEEIHGHLGYAYYWKIVEFMAGEWSGFGEPEVETTLRYLRQLLRTQEPKIKLVLSDMQNIGLLNFTLDGNKLIVRMDALKSIRDNSSTKKSDARGLSRELKHYIVQRDARLCQYCGVSLVGQSSRKEGTKFGESLNFDHFIPFSSGGKSVASNVVLSCSFCNQIKWMHHPDDLEKNDFIWKERIAKVRTKLSLELDKELETDKEVELDNTIVVVPQKAAQPNRKQTIPFADFKPTKDIQGNWLDLYEYGYIEREWIKIRTWLVSQPAKNKKTERGWIQFVSNWLDRGWVSYQKNVNSKTDPFSLIEEKKNDSTVFSTGNENIDRRFRTN